MIYKINKVDYLKSRNGMPINLKEISNYYDYFLGLLVFNFNILKQNQISNIENGNIIFNDITELQIKKAYEYCISNCNIKDKSIYSFIYLSLISKKKSLNKSLTKI